MNQVEQLAAKLAKADVALQKAAQYVADVQPVIDEHNVIMDKFIKRAHQTIDGLVNKGLVPQRKSNELVDKVASDITLVFDVIDKMAELALVTPSLGNASAIKVATEITDPFVRLVLTGETSGKLSNNGMVD